MRRSLALATVLAALGPAAAAHAAATVGSDLSKAATQTLCATPCTAFTVDNATNAPSTVAPFDGVVVHWSVKSGSAASGLALRALRPAGTNSYTGAATSEQQSMSQAGTTTFASHMAVKAGDILGLDDRTAGGAKIAATSTTTAVFVFGAPIGSFTATPSKQANRELLMNADIEHDADGDGYGDETQDLCPDDPTRHTACLSNLSVSVRPDPAPLTVGRVLTFTIKVSNAGPSTAQDVGLVVNLPFSATPLQVRAGRGFCGGGYTLTCRLGPIEHDDSGTVVLTVRPEVVGTLLMNATASTPTAQTSTDDDTFTSDVTVLPPTLRLLDLRLSQPVFHVGGRTAIKWYMTDAAAVNVKLEQISRKGRHLARGSFPVKGKAGPNAVLFKGRMPRHKPLKAGTYRFTVSAATADGRVATPGQLSFTVLRRHRR
ncbi:MAG: DUF11 domain-containing protein [Actinobacteria bacterium]|nr:MAG: DUF11 domain-containing protein [Actinomycetota bacterium]